jgi:hypothetical protein
MDGKFKLQLQDSDFFWRLDKHIALSEKKSPLILHVSPNQHVSVTSLLEHIVAQPTKCRYLPKNSTTKHFFDLT